MRVLVLGASGMLGTDIMASPPDGITPIAGGLGDERVDITVPADVSRALDATRPDWVINCAAYTKVDVAEREPERAYAVNATGVLNVAAECAQRGVRIVHFSTDYVFDGANSASYGEDEPTRPLNVYGASKLAGERALLESGARALVIRTQWLFGRAGQSFPRSMWRRARTAAPVRVVNDQWGRPTYTGHLAKWTWALVLDGASGIYHAANAGIATWFDVARAVYAAEGVEQLVEPCTTVEYPTPARRPRFSVLDTAKLARRIGPIEDWQPALAEAIQAFRVESPS